jgi:hypothetical protein
LGLDASVMQVNIGGLGFRVQGVGFRDYPNASVMQGKNAKQIAIVETRMACDQGLGFRCRFGF